MRRRTEPSAPQFQHAPNCPSMRSPQPGQVQGSDAGDGRSARSITARARSASPGRCNQSSGQHSTNGISPTTPRAGRSGRGNRYLAPRAGCADARSRRATATCGSCARVRSFAGQPATTSISRCAAKQRSDATWRSGCPAAVPSSPARPAVSGALSRLSWPGTGGGSGSPTCPVDRLERVRAEVDAGGGRATGSLGRRRVARIRRIRTPQLRARCRRTRSPDQQRRRRRGRTRRGHVGRRLALGHGHQSARRGAWLPRSPAPDAQPGRSGRSSTSRARRGSRRHRRWARTTRPRRVSLRSPKRSSASCTDRACRCRSRAPGSSARACSRRCARRLRKAPWRGG